MRDTADGARRRARERTPKSPGLQTAYVNGWQAARGRKPIEACPYKVRNGRGGRRSGWVTVWRHAWIDGWRSGR